MSPSRRVVLTFLSLAVSTGVGTARAEPPGPGPVSASTERSYAGQTILVDAIGASLFGGGLLLAAEDSGASVALSLLGLGTYALGAPIVHGAHDRWGAATGSFFLRILVVPVAGLAGGAVGAKACPSGSEGEDTGSVSRAASAASCAARPSAACSGWWRSARSTRRSSRTSRPRPRLRRRRARWSSRRSIPCAATRASCSSARSERQGRGAASIAQRTPRALLRVSSASACGSLASTIPAPAVTSKRSPFSTSVRIAIAKSRSPERVA